MEKKKRQAQAKAEHLESNQTEAMLEVIIGLLGRSIFPEDKLKVMVTKGKKKHPEQYVKAYNLLDGGHGVTEIAKEIGVAQPTLTSVLSTWKGLGIVYEVVRSGRTVYRGLYKLRSRREETSEDDFDSEQGTVDMKEPAPEATIPESPEQSHNSNQP